MTQTMQSNADYAEWFRSRPKRLEVDLSQPNMSRLNISLLADIGCETPRIHYENFNGKFYKYFYAIGSDVDAEHPGTLIKVDTITGKVISWWEPDCYPSEPVFIPRPDSKEEDDGVILSALIFGANDRQVGLLVLDAKTFVEEARAVFNTPSSAPKCLHGWFLPEKH